MKSLKRQRKERRRDQLGVIDKYASCKSLDAFLKSWVIDDLGRNRVHEAMMRPSIFDNFYMTAVPE